MNGASPESNPAAIQPQRTIFPRRLPNFQIPAVTRTIRVTLVSRVKWFVVRITGRTMSKNMPDVIDAAPPRNLFGPPCPGDLFAAIDPESPEGRTVLEKIAARIGATRRPGAHSDIPAGVTYLTQFVVHDLDFPTRDALPRRNLLDLGLIYGDVPSHDSYAYQVPN